MCAKSTSLDHSNQCKYEPHTTLFIGCDSETVYLPFSTQVNQFNVQQTTSVYLMTLITFTLLYPNHGLGYN